MTSDRAKPLKIVILGLSITSSWGNGHATTYRGLVRGLAARGHQILFLERNCPWYAANRDQPNPADIETRLYDDFDELRTRFEKEVHNASLVIVGSFVPEGVRVGEWVNSIARGHTAFYDIDTPVTMAKLEAGDYEYLNPQLIPRYDLYLSFTGGSLLRQIERRSGSSMVRVLYCSVDPEIYRPRDCAPRWDCGYLGTYSDDRQPALDALMLQPARQWRHGRFAVAGALYPKDLAWPSNVDHCIHLPPDEHAEFYCSQRFTLNITRQAMKAAGFSPSVRLFEAGCCGVPVISDSWAGLETLFEPDREILLAAGPEDTLRHLKNIKEERRRALGAAARKRVLENHTPARRALQLEEYVKELDDNSLAHTPRRHRRGGQSADGLAAGLSPEFRRKSADAAGRANAVPLADSGRL